MLAGSSASKMREREEEIGLMLLATIEIKWRGSSKRTKEKN